MADEDNDPLRPRPTQDSRGFYMLPQAPMDSGYYVYGDLYEKPAKGAYQYAHPIMQTAIQRVAWEWQAIDPRRIGVGDISLANGPKPPDHDGHRSGLDVDIRPMRKDGRELPIRWWEKEYDREATRKLIGLFQTFAPVILVIFNDPDIPFLSRAVKHDNHMHFKLRG